MKRSLDALRRSAKTLHRAYETGEPEALARVRDHPPRNRGALRHADFLHIIAQEMNFASWPRLKLAAETEGLERAARQQRLKMALLQGQSWAVQQLLWDTPDLARGLTGLEIALYDLEAVRAALAADPEAARRQYGPHGAMMHLAYSCYFRVRPEAEDDMIAMAELLLAHGADVNDSAPAAPGSDHRLSALYAALGHAGNLRLADWLLENGADPNDGESLYHATELGHRDGVALLLRHGARPEGTNALLRAMDFHDHDMVSLLIAHGARADEFSAEPVGGEAPWVLPALHQAARRMSDARMVALLLDAGADPGQTYAGVSAYAFARIFGNAALATALEAQGADQPLSAIEAQLVAAAEGASPGGTFINAAQVPPVLRTLLQDLIRLPEKRVHVARLVAMGFPFDTPDDSGLTPVQVAGWEGLPEALRDMLRLKPDLSHVNGYGGRLLDTILHGAEQCPDRAQRDHGACLQLVLEEGVGLPRRAIAQCGREDLCDLMAQWAQDHPGQLIGPEPL